MEESSTLLTPKIKPIFNSVRLRRLGIKSASCPYKSPLLSATPVSSNADNSDAFDQSKSCLPHTSSSCDDVEIGNQTPTMKLKSMKSPSYNRSLFRQKLSRGFKSPFAQPSLPISDNEDQNEDSADINLKERLHQLQSEYESLNKRITLLTQEGCSVDQLQWYIDKLHEYNDVKDIAQILMGKIAENERRTIKDIHQSFGLGLDD